MAETEHGLALRGGVVGQFLIDPAVSGRVGARVYGKDVPADRAWPFIRVEINDAIPDEASCWTGQDTSGTANGFVRPTDDKPDAEAEAYRLLKAMKKAIAGGITLELEPGEEGPVPVVLELVCTSATVRIDRDEPGAYHARVEFLAKTVEEA